MLNKIFRTQREGENHRRIGDQKHESR